MGFSPSSDQQAAWDDELAVLNHTLRRLRRHPHIEDWGVVLEYELPLEGGRRPDVVLLGDGEANAGWLLTTS